MLFLFQIINRQLIQDYLLGLFQVILDFNQVLLLEIIYELGFNPNTTNNFVGDTLAS